MKSKLYLAIIACLFPVITFAASFSVGPVSITLDRTTKTGLVKVVNDDIKPLQMQMKLQDWVQDDQGKDQYTDSEDLVYFPRIMTLQPKEERLIRVGIKVLALEQEKSYTLFLEEIPSTNINSKKQGPQVVVATRFGVSVFISPHQIKKEGVINNIALNKGVVSFNIKNSGNVHISIPAIHLGAGELFSKDMAGGTILAGSTRTFSAPIPAEICNKIEVMDMAMQSYDATNKLELKGSLKVDHTQCQ